MTKEEKFDHSIIGGSYDRYPLPTEKPAEPVKETEQAPLTPDFSNQK